MTTNIRCWLVSDGTCQMFVAAPTRGKALLEFVGRYSDCDPEEVFQKGSHFHARRVPELDGVAEPDLGTEVLFLEYGGWLDCAECGAYIIAEPEKDVEYDEGMVPAYQSDGRAVCPRCAGPDAQPIRRTSREAKASS